MKIKFPAIVLTILLFAVSAGVNAQNQDQKQKTPIEIASEQADRLQIDLKLNDYQLFKTDSILQTNLTGVTNQFEQMRKGGLQNPESYREVQKIWQVKTSDAFEILFTLEQFDKYLKMTGVPTKERKKKIAEIKEKSKEIKKPR